jgi:hypothetical protein
MSEYTPLNEKSRDKNLINPASDTNNDILTDNQYDNKALYSEANREVRENEEVSQRLYIKY